MNKGGVMKRYKCVTVEGWPYYLVFLLAFVVCVFALFGAVMAVYVWVCGLEHAAIETMKAWGRGAGGFK
jgi:hypothetical protein